MFDSIKDVLSRAAAAWPDNPVLLFDHEALVFTFRSLQVAVEYAQNRLLREQLAKPGARVGLMLPNCPQFPVLWLALCSMGAVAVPINRHLRSDDLNAAVASSGVQCVLTNSDCIELVRAGTGDQVTHVVDVTETDWLVGPVADEVPVVEPKVYTPRSETLANIQLTSGSTGLSKACELTHAYWLNIARVMCTHGPQIGVRDVLLTSQPFYYMDPMWNLVTCLQSGARLVVLDGFHPTTFMAKVRQYRVTYFYCLGVMPAMLLTQPEGHLDRVHSLRYVSCSGIPRGRHVELEERFGVPWYELYGSTETGIDIMPGVDQHDLCLETQSMGVAVEGRELRVVDPESLEPVSRETEGLLLVRGTYTFDGYLESESKNEGTASAGFKDGWYVTGDLVIQHDNDLVRFVGRVKDIIRRSGENISAYQVEQVVAQHPDVAVCACIPRSDDLRGEEVLACLVLNSDVTDFASVARSIHDFTSARLAYYKVPRFWNRYSSLPRTVSDKIAKKLIVDIEPVDTFDFEIDGAK